MTSSSKIRRVGRAGLIGVVTTWLITTSAGHDASGTFVLKQDRPTLPQSRRSLLTGALFAGLPFASFLDPEPAAARIVTIGLPCQCCERDWCATSCIEASDGFETKCNCYEFLSELVSSEQKVVSGGLYKLPSDASRARLDAIDAGLGEEGWASQLGWKDANLLKWNPEDGSHLKVKPSNLNGAGDGLFTTQPLPKNTVQSPEKLPPYQGKALSIGEFRTVRGTKDMDYVWCPLREEGLFNFTDDQLMAAEKAGAATTFCVDGREAADKNPTRYINAARTQEQCKKVNVKICEFGDVAYFRTTKDVKKGAELITDYGSEYWEDFEGC